MTMSNATGHGIDDITMQGIVDTKVEGLVVRAGQEAANGRLNTSGLVPVEFYVVVELDPVAEKTAGGLLLPNSVQDKDKISAQEGTIVAASPLAFTYEEWPEGSRKPQVGDRILFKRYDGHLHERNGRDYKLLNDKSIIAIVEPPEAAVREAA